jgi:hypothetical protein
MGMLGQLKFQDVTTGSGRFTVRLRRLAFGGILLAGLVVPTGFAHAQASLSQADLQQVDSQRPGAEVPVCSVEIFTEEASRGDAADGRAEPTAAASLIAQCNGTGLYLGEADQHRVFTHGPTGAMVVEIERLGRIRIILLARDAQGAMTAEDLTGELAVAAGRSQTGGFRGMAADFARFSRDGTIEVSAPGAEGVGARGASRQFSLAEHLARAEGNRSAARAANVGGAQ